ncbi:hypothetical protein GF359_05835, partial [candidate division WOR-3 bacterium]|nr:hypothetical protein [candidate division WOR-3 bacterium]MBD3364718.1 hypothetical protein [candidate division WOR-3 bacterium]
MKNSGNISSQGNLKGGRMAKRFAVSAALVVFILAALTGCGNHAPEIMELLLNNVKAENGVAQDTVQVGDTVTISCTVNDPDANQTLEYEWLSLNEGSAKYKTQSFNWSITTPPPQMPTTYEFALTVTDGYGGIAYDTLTVIVNGTTVSAEPVDLLDQGRIGSSEVELIWRAAPVDWWNEYRVYRGDGSPEPMNVIAKIGYSYGDDRNDTTYTDTDLEPGRDYFYKIAAVDSAGNEALSNRRDVTTLRLELLGSLTLGGGHGLRIANTGNYIFVAAREQSVKGFTINSTGPATAANIPHPNANYNAWAYDVFITGNILHTAFGNEGYWAYDITNPLNPNDTLFVTPTQLTGSLTAEARSVFADGNDVFIGCTDHATGYHTITWITVDIPNAAFTFNAIDTLHDTPKDIHVDGNYVYVAIANAGLEVLRWSVLPVPAFSYVGLVSTNDEANQVYVSGTEAYVAASSEGLLVIDISNKNNPYLAAQWPDPEGQPYPTNAQGIY